MFGKRLPGFKVRTIARKLEGSESPISPAASDDGWERLPWIGSYEPVWYRGGVRMFGKRLPEFKARTIARKLEGLETPTSRTASDDG